MTCATSCALISKLQYATYFQVRFCIFCRRTIRLALCAGALTCLGAAGTLAPLSQADRVSSRTVQVGDVSVRLDVERRNAGGPIYINLHRNESTSVEIARELLATQPGTLVTIHHPGQRLIDFKLDGMTYTFDPNRIFAREGIQKTLRANSAGRYSAGAHAQVQELANSILSLLNDRSTALIVALHNNAGTNYSFESYRGKGKEARNARHVTSAAGRTADAFFLVTTQALDQALRAERFNVVFQSDHPVDDGSLSVWAQHTQRSYVNVESKFRETVRQREMLDAVVRACKTLAC